MTFEEQALARQNAGLRDKYLDSENLLIEERIERHRNPGAPKLRAKPMVGFFKIKKLKLPAGALPLNAPTLPV